MRSRRLHTALALAILGVIPVFVALFSVFGPLQTDAVHHYGGLSLDQKPPLALGEPTIDPNFGVTAQALGIRAALDVVAGHLPLWNHYQGFGAPLLGEMQSAALFPPTWLMALPHGQTLEQAVLQGLGGLGAFLFFRRFGVGWRAALAGGMAFEVNGVFAWLRNAIFNPVAFLPWLFLVVECLHAQSVAGRGLRRRLPFVGLGAGTAALALYAGFPEEVYLYGLLLVVWSVFRMASLSLAQTARFVGDLLSTGVLATLLSAPLLLAFAAYLRVAELGGHGGAGFAGVWLGPAGLIQYLSPYLYGRIFWSRDPVVADIWSSTGGYVGFVPVVLAIAGLIVPGHRAAKLVLAAWIVLALGVTHGAPLLYPLFTLIPLTKAAAVFRYLNISWIFCFIVLSVLFLDRVPHLPPRVVRRTLGLSIGLALLVAGLAAAAARPLIAALLSASSHERILLVSGAASLAGLALVIGGAALARRTATTASALGAVMVLEAVLWFAVPYQSYPRGGRLDLDLLAFLRRNAGHQRVLNTDQAGISPNYGSSFGFSLFDYDDLPSPKLTADYIKDRLDPAANSISYGPTPEGLTPEQQADHRKLLRARLPAFARAGVKFVLAGEDFNLVAPYDLAPREGDAYALAPGQGIEVSGRADPTFHFSVSAVSVSIGQRDADASGIVAADLCVDAVCARGQTAVEQAADSSRLSIALDRPVEIEPGSGYRVRLARREGAGTLALRLSALASAQARPKVEADGAAVPGGFAPDIRLNDDAVRLAYAGQSMRVYELSGVRDYVAAPDCDLRPLSRDRVQASCRRPSTLTRLELSMDGWSASINGAPAAIGIEDGVFQTLALPAGETEVAFAYQPRGFTAALAGACLALFTLLLVFADAARRAFAPRARDPFSL